MPNTNSSVYEEAGKYGKAFTTVVQEHAPALLVSYVYVEPFLKKQASYCYRDWVLDSGAFSAHMSGTEIKLQDYIDFCKKILERDPTLTEVFALDVIGDAKASQKNVEEMWRQGVPAIPCFHANEPESFIYEMAKDYPKIALGGVAMQKGEAKNNWAEQCFARIWPKKVHGFGFGSQDGIMAVPWHSVDSTNWEIGPCAFGRWQKFGPLSVRGSNQDLRCEVKFYLDLEAKARVRWKKEMKELAALDDMAAPAVRLAQNGPQMSARGEEHVLAKYGPKVRLAWSIAAAPVRTLAELGKDYSIEAHVESEK